MASTRDKSNVLIGAPDIAAGAFSIGKVQDSDSNYPDDASTALDESFSAKPGGYVSEDGLTKTSDRSTEKIKDWNGDVVLVVQTDQSTSLQFTCLESSNADVLKMIYGEDNVNTSSGVVEVIDTSDELPSVSLDFLMNGGQGKKIRVFAPEAKVTDTGDVSYTKSDAIKYQVTLECMDPLGDGKKLFQYIEDTNHQP